MTIRALSLPPTDTEIDDWIAVLAAARAVDLPQGTPPTRTEVAGRLRVTPARGRAALWTADGGAGVAALLLFTDEANAHTAFLDVLAVHPDARRRGLGRALWEQVRAELLAHGRTSVSTLVDLGGPGQAFAESLGFENVLPMAWYEQDVSRRRSATAAVAPGYELRAWHGLVPDDWAAPLATAHGAMQDAPMGDIDEKIEPWTPQRLHAAHRLVLDRGGEITTVAAVTSGARWPRTRNWSCPTRPARAPSSTTPWSPPPTGATAWAVRSSCTCWSRPATGIPPCAGSSPRWPTRTPRCGR